MHFARVCIACALNVRNGEGLDGGLLCLGQAYDRNEYGTGRLPKAGQNLIWKRVR
jgi:hypothetical protein